MQDGNKNLKKKKADKTVTAREYDKSKRKSVPHGTNNVNKAGNHNQKTTKVKAHKKVLTDGGYMYI